MNKLFLSLCMLNSIIILYSADNSRSPYYDAIIKDNILECPSLSITLNLNEIDPLEVQTYKELMQEHTPLLISRYSIKINGCSFNKYAYAYSFFDWQSRNTHSSDPVTQEPIDEQTYFSIEIIKDKVFVRNLGNDLMKNPLLYHHMRYESAQGSIDKMLACKRIARIYKQEKDMLRAAQWLDRAACIENNYPYIPLQDPETAIARLKQLAQAGDVKLQTELGYIYKCNNDFEAAIMFLTMAAQANDSVAMGELGNLYVKKHDFASAALWYEQASALGHYQAILNRAMLYEQAHEPVNAFTWYTKAAQLGCVSLDLFYIFSKVADKEIDHALFQTYLQKLKQNSRYINKYKTNHPERYAQARACIEQIDPQFFEAMSPTKKRKRDLSDPS